MNELATAGANRLFDYGVLGVLVVFLGLACWWFLHALEKTREAHMEAMVAQRNDLMKALADATAERKQDKLECAEERADRERAFHEERHEFSSVLTGMSLNQSVMAARLEDLGRTLTMSERGSR